MKRIEDDEVILLMKENKKFMLKKRKEKEDVEVIRRMFDIKKGRKIEEYKVESVVMEKKEIG
jgi:hypothetical protein